MPNNLVDELRTLNQRSGSNSGRLATDAERAAFVSNVKKDIAALMYQHNVVSKPLFDALSSLNGANALAKGISGGVVFTDVDADAASAEAYYSPDMARARTIKETVDVLLSELSRLENELQQVVQFQAYDDSDLRSAIGVNELDLVQLATDTQGDQYTLDGDGQADLNYSLSQAIDAIGAFFSGFPGTGNTYSASYPALALSVLLSDVVIDTTIPQSAVTDLPADLGYIRTFIGMATSGPETPVYSAHSANVYLTDGWSLEKALATLDSAIGTGAQTLQDAYDDGGAGVAGQIKLLNTQGGIDILNDTSTAVPYLQRWIDTASDEVARVDDDRLYLRADKTLDLAVHGSDPSVTAGDGRLNARPDSVSADTELHYQNDNGSTGNAQITRDGIVKELEVGYACRRPTDFEKFAAAAGPVQVVEEYGPAPDDMVVRTLDFDPTTAETGYTTISIPVDENGDSPTRVKFIGHFLLKPNGGAYPGGDGIQFDIKLSDSLSTRPMSNKTLINPQWDAGSTANEGGLSGANIDHVIVLDWSIVTLGNNPQGVLGVKLTRDTTDPNDDWADDVGLIELQAIWYR